MIADSTIPDELKKYGDFCGKQVRAPSLAKGDECTSARGCPPTLDGKTRYCVNVAKKGSNENVFACRECLPSAPMADCSCPAEHYCIKDKTQGKQGTCKRFDSHKDVVGKKCSSAAAEGSDLWCGFVSKNLLNSVEQKVVEWTGECSHTNTCAPPLAKRGLICGLANKDELSSSAPKQKLAAGSDRQGPALEFEPNNPKVLTSQQTAGMPATTNDEPNVPRRDDDRVIRDK